MSDISRPTPSRRAWSLALPVAVLALLTSACTAADPADERRSGSGSAETAAAADVTDVATGLEAPWAMVRLDSGSTLVSQRDDGTVVEVADDGSTRTVGTVDGVVHQGEGGLLGLAVLPGETTWLYAYETTATDNRVVRLPLTGDAGSYALGEQEDVLTGLAKASNHDGGRIAFGPDGMLYVTVGDANDRDAAQDPESLNGKILRMTPTGGVPDDNPTAGSLVYTLGHRNPQGIAWDDEGRMWASEFGQNTYDELNLIEPGENYGWPEVEGEGSDSRFTDPVVTWSTDEASPSGLVSIGDRLYLAGLGGERLWVIDPGSGDASSASATALLEGDLGRIRDVAEGPGGTLRLLTNNTDGRGDPRRGDDRLVELPLAG
ncbi:Quinoprotein glucose dehydrogenase B [Frondihabitans sp. 762G35]|uniref:PQQ-dependent sugar dehydrogenase n=1 Tax=Frondihabitans sp. 762G35 TaxID=1446794 RepID=UPI000D209435|nr:PQQ-dependent sugar dehydrogenase [Frondihabitans sp. 762G35]ARC56953.1 Quinoprotein glucose dehydrogenase B [Frondihabitans sp. 762G35]